MKTSCLPLLLVTLLVACKTDVRSGEAPSVPPLRERRLAQCGSAAARNGHALSASSPLCEHQILAEPLTTERLLVVPFRLVTEERIQYCLVDDDGEAHQAELWRNGLRWLSVEDGGGCKEAVLPSGDYSLQIRHAKAGGTDLTPDIVHTQWTDAAEGKSASLKLTTNACPGCDLSGVEFPRLGGIGYVLGYGYAGNYQGADFSRGICKVGSVGGCAFGYQNIVSNFDGATFDDLRVVGNPYFFGTTMVQGSGRTTYRGASFRNLPKTDIAYVFAGDYTGADFSGAKLGPVMTPGTAVLKNVNLDRATAASSSNPLSDALLDVAAYRAFRRLGVDIKGSRVDVGRGDDLTALAIDGATNRWVWPTKGTGELDLAGTSFRQSTLSNLTFPCEGRLGSLAEVDFTQASLTQVGFAGCDLSRSKWSSGTFANVDFHDARLDGSELSGSRLSSLDFTRASLLDVILTTKGETPAASGLVFTQARVRRRLSGDGLVLVDMVGTGADFSGSNFDGVVFSKPTFPGAVLDDTSFRNALLTGAVMDSSTGARVDFDGATFQSSSLAGVRFRASSFDATVFGTTRLVGARFCGGNARGTQFGTSNLVLALLPATDVTVVASDGVVECPRVEGLDPYSAVQTSVSTTCPDGGLGPCATAPRWSPALPYPVCCKPSFQDPDKCVRYMAGAACTTACDCASLKCNAGSKTCE